MNKNEELYNTLDKKLSEFCKTDEEFWEERPVLARRDTRRIVIYIQRRVIGPFINRQDNDGDTIRCRIHGHDFIRVPPRKWKSMEKIRGVQLCRVYNAIDGRYLYNEVQQTRQLANPVSVIFGDTVARSGETAGLPSMAVYEQGLSIQEVRDATDRLTHNALSEFGTMWNITEDKFRDSLFDTLYVKEGTVFLQSITIDAPSPEAVFFMLFCLDARRYGAGKQVLGNNIENTVIGILLTHNEPPVTPFTILEELVNRNENITTDNALKLLKSKVKNWGEKWIDGDEVEKVRDELRKDRTKRKEIINHLSTMANEYHEFVYGVAENE